MEAVERFEFNGMPSLLLCHMRLEPTLCPEKISAGVGLISSLRRRGELHLVQDVALKIMPARFPSASAWRQSLKTARSDIGDVLALIQCDS